MFYSWNPRLRSHNAIVKSQYLLNPEHFNLIVCIKNYVVIDYIFLYTQNTKP